MQCRQAIAKAVLSRLAGLHPLLADTPRPLRLAVAARMAVCRSHGFVYIRIPKAANSTITRTLAMHLHRDQRESIEADKSGKLAKTSFQTILDPNCFTRRMLLANYRVFSFFRNPYARVLSAYLDKMQSRNAYRYPWVADALGVKSTAHITFPDFIGFLENGNLYGDAHWAPQVKCCPLPVDELYYKGDIENLRVGLKSITTEIFGRECWAGIAIREHNRQHANEQLQSYYTDSLRERVYRLYEEDFLQLNYKRNSI